LFSGSAKAWLPPAPGWPKLAFDPAKIFLDDRDASFVNPAENEIGRAHV